MMLPIRAIEGKKKKSLIIVPICCLALLYYVWIYTHSDDEVTPANIMQVMEKIDIGDGDSGVSHSNDSANMSTNNKINECIELRGANGYWFRDEKLSLETFYVDDYGSRKWARSRNSNSSFYPGNQFNWKDISFGRDDRHCQIHPVNISSFCNEIQKRQIRRILFVGDSLSGSQYKSLVQILGYRRVNKTSHFIDCPDFPIKIYFLRENLGPNFRLTNITGREDATPKHNQQFGSEIPYCAEGQYHMQDNDYCPWHLLYNATNDKSLLIMNQGAHFHSLQTFSQSFDKFVQLFNSIAHPGDIVVYRSTVPGHYDCWNASSKISPLNLTHDKFLERYSTNMYDWNLFDTYNSYVKKRLNDLTPIVTSHYLNVYNMTVLRPDEHKQSNDCLHYRRPGPVDFWNHLLFTNLADI